MRVSVWLLALVLQVAAVAGRDAGEWPQFRGGPSLTGVSDARLPASPELAWTHDAGDPMESSAAVAGGRVFVGTAGGELQAVDLKSGELVWRYEAEDAIGESSAAVSGGSVYIADLTGMLHAVSEADGTRRWTFQTDGEVKSSPVVMEDSVLVGSYDGYLYCLSAGGGKLRWRQETDGPLHCTPGVRDGIAYVSGCDGMLRGIRVSDGQPVVTVDVGAYTGASPSLDGDRAVFGTFDNQVLAVGLKAAAVLWRYQAAERAAPFYSSAAQFGGKVVVGGRDKLVHCLDASTGKALWTHTTRARVDSSPAIADGRVWVGSFDGRLYSLDLETGKQLWEFRTGGRISASPAVAAGRVIVGSQDGLLYCFGGGSP